MPQKLTDDLAAWADVVLSMCYGDQCPHIPGKRYIDWDLPDPKEMPLPDVRRIRDEIQHRVQELMHHL